jgi:hypothetical protein
MFKENYICDSKKFEFRNGYIGMPVEIDALPDFVTAEGNEFKRKSEFHVTLLCVKDILARSGDVEQQILDFFCTFVTEKDISIVSYTGEFRLAEKEKKKTVVAMCVVSNLEIFLDLLGKELDVGIPKQPTHVTLYTLPPDPRGIALSSPEDLRQLSHPIEVSDAVKDALRLA